MRYISSRSGGLARTNATLLHIKRSLICDRLRLISYVHAYAKRQISKYEHRKCEPLPKLSVAPMVYRTEPKACTPTVASMYHQLDTMTYL
jgi:hypothetical protein